jgi:phosphoribulokinase
MRWPLDAQSSNRSMTTAPACWLARSSSSHADIVVRFTPTASCDDPLDTLLSAELLLRPTIHLTLQRDEHGRPVDCLYVHGDAPREESRRSEPLAITQLMLLYHLLDAVR